MRLEKLPKERYAELREDFQSFGEDRLPEGEIYVLVDDEIIGWFLVETVKHVGPFFVKEGYRDRGVGTLLAHHANQLLNEEFYISCLSEQTEKMCEKFGMAKIEGTLFMREANG
jgi:GNAT superfamily N-acetyltransferase